MTTFEPAVILIAAVMLGLLATLLVLLLRWRRTSRWRRPSRSSQASSVFTPPTAAPSAPAPAIDVAALTAALQEAKSDGQHKRVAGLQLSLARWNAANGEGKAAAELLRDCIRSSTVAGMRDTHAKARVELGDIEHAAGDLSSACEHWQIARSLFHELHNTSDHKAVEERMRRNGCPTDWVLTDF
jgi:hypothetical protein